MQIIFKDPFKEKIKDTQKKAAYQRRMQSLEPIPHEDQNKVTMYLVIFLALLCNLFQIITASTAVFTFLADLANGIPLLNILAGLITIALLGTLEYFQWETSRPFFQSAVRDHEELKKMNLVKMLLLTACSVFLSHHGSHDAIVYLRPAPIMAKVELEDLSAIEKEYDGYYSESLQAAEDYKVKSTYRGKLSERRATEYKQMKEESSSIVNKKEAALEDARQRNATKKAAAEKEFTEENNRYDNSSYDKGTVLAVAVILAAGIFYLCTWWLEDHEWKVICQYADLKDAAQGTPNKRTNFSQNLNSSMPDISATFSIPIQPNNEQQEPMSELNYNVEHLIIQKGDKMLFEHERKGKISLFYSLSGCKGMVDKWTIRLQDSIKAKERNGDIRKINAIPNRERQVAYWTAAVEALKPHYPKS